jgi:hypothetical protein
MENVKKRETERIFTFEGRTFRVSRLDAMTAMYTATVLMSKGLGMAGTLLNKYAGNSLPPLPPNLPAMSKAEFFSLQRDLLSVCAEKLSGGWTKVFDEAGNLALSDFEYNLPLALTLTANSLVFNLADFFDESLWTKLKENLADIFPSGQETSPPPSGGR